MLACQALCKSSDNAETQAQSALQARLVSSSSVDRRTPPEGSEAGDGPQVRHLEGGLADAQLLQSRQALQEAQAGEALLHQSQGGLQHRTMFNCFYEEP